MHKSLPQSTVVASLMTGLALWQGGWLVLEGTLTIGTLIAFMNYTGLFFEPIQQMARQFAEIQMAQAAAERIQKLLNTEPSRTFAAPRKGHTQGAPVVG